jgi:uncharacterized protein YuzE
MSITIASIEFDHHAYDERGDLLYVSVGEPRVPAETDAMPEGHAIDFDADDNVVGMVLVNLRFLVNRDGELRITWLDGHVSRDERSVVFAAAA